MAIRQAKVTALIGRNGAGKTTLAKHLNGLLKPTTGKVCVMGIDTSEKTASEMASIVGYAFQNPEDQLFEASVFEEVAFGPRNIGMNSTQIEQAVNSALSQVGLLAFASTHPYNLNYGQRKMLCIASTLALQPQIVVLDEPNAGQDHLGLVLLGKILKELNENGRTVIVISHDLEFVARYADRTVVMNEGTVHVDDLTRVVLTDSSALASSGLRPPQITRLAMRLRRHGVSSNVMIPEEFVEDFARVAGRGT